ncbi:Hypothetical predicted protein [Olea europaea subsp. europaea]|uniref:Uncharacterized protein n=1 Tax=Olea europaea subsp. europaea TaxID=158383 RepID=A0A8S0RA30_OLEEU|nr:Hypothetical predicted protein [Olea europaea subsp. europaea]
MAETIKKACKTFTKSRVVSLFIFLLFIVPLSARRIKSLAILEVSLASQERVVLDSHTRNQYCTTKLHGGATTPVATAAAGCTTTAMSTNREFQGASHEVPSGPNPEGNK